MRQLARAPTRGCSCKGSAHFWRPRRWDCPKGVAPAATTSSRAPEEPPRQYQVLAKTDAHFLRQDGRTLRTGTCARNKPSAVISSIQLPPTGGRVARREAGLEKSRVGVCVLARRGSRRSQGCGAGPIRSYRRWLFRPAPHFAPNETGGAVLCKDTRQRTDTPANLVVAESIR